MNSLSPGKTVTATVALVAAAGLQAEVLELEPNHPISAAQHLTVPGEVALKGHLGNGGENDLDFFTFSGNAGDVVTVDIDNGIGGAQSVDTVLAVFDGAGAVLRFSDDSTIDPGSISTKDPRIENFVLPLSGAYTVGVSNFPRYFGTGGVARDGLVPGDYTLVISGVSDPVKQIAIVIKPGDEAIAPINPKSRGKIPVALLGAADFDVMTIAAKSLRFGPTGTEESLWKCNWTGTDINGDGRVDLICHFDNQKAAFRPTDAEALLTGEANGRKFEGRGYLKVVPAKAP